MLRFQSSGGEYAKCRHRPLLASGRPKGEVAKLGYAFRRSRSARASFRSAVSKPLGEPAVDFGKHRACFVASASRVKQARETRRGTQLQRFRALALSNPNGGVEAMLGLQRTLRTQRAQQFSFKLRYRALSAPSRGTVTPWIGKMKIPSS
jgi:hypothetical protein